MSLSRLSRRFRLDVLEDRTVPSITLPTPGTPGPVVVTGTDNADQLIIRAGVGVVATLQFSDDGGQTFTSAALSDVTGVSVSGLGGDDTLTIDHTNGFVGRLGSALNVKFDGGAGIDVVAVTGDPRTAAIVTVSAADTVDAGTLTASAVGSALGLSVDYSHTSLVRVTMPADSLTFNATEKHDGIRLVPGVTVGGQNTLRIAGPDFQGNANGLDDLTRALPADPVATGVSFVPVDVAGAATVTVNALGGDDLIELNDGRNVSGLNTLVIDGGAGNDVLLRGASPPGVTVTVNNVETTSADSGADMFIQNLYFDRLKRFGSTDEVAGWKAALNASGRAAVVAGIDLSDEALQREVRVWYNLYLGRDAEAGAAEMYAAALRSGVSEETALDGFFNSTEFHNRSKALIATGNANERFVAALYQTILNRDASSAEIAGWVGVLAGNPNADIAAGFLASQEHRTALVGSFYLALLHRTASPAEISGWAGSVLGAGAIRRSFEGSAEYFDARMAGATVVTFSGGSAQVTGSSRDSADVRFFMFTVPSGVSTLTVSASTTNGVAPLVEVVTANGAVVFQTAPDNGVNVGSVGVTAGATYFIEVRAPHGSASNFTVDLTLS